MTATDHYYTLALVTFFFLWAFFHCRINTQNATYTCCAESLGTTFIYFTLFVLVNEGIHFFFFYH